MMRRWFLFFGVFIVTVGVVFAAYAENESMKADQVIEKYLAAVGGREALSSIKDRTITAKLMVMGMTGTMEWHEKAPNKMHQAVDMVMAKVESWFDGERGYRIDPMQGAGAYSDEDLEEARESYVIAPLLHLKDRGWTGEYVGEEPLGDGSAHVVRFTDSSGGTHTYYFDSSTYYLIKMVSPLPAREGEGIQELSFSDYREVDGVKFPFYITRTATGMMSEIVIDSIETNTELEDSVFRYEQDPWRILARHLEAIGGQDAWQELQSIRREATLQIGEMQGIATTVWKTPSFFYHQVEIGTAVVKLGSDGENGWMGEQAAGEVAVKDWRTYTFLWSNRYLFPGSGVNAYYRGTEKVGERDAYVVSLQFPFGAEVTCYYDRESYLLLKDVSRHSAPGIDNLLIGTLYGDYRWVEGLKLPFSFSEEVPLTPPITAAFKMTDYQLNQAIDESLFRGVATTLPPE